MLRLPARCLALAVALTLLVPLFSLGCSVNPVSNRQEVVFVSEEEEIEVGKEAAKAVEAEMGLVTDAKLKAYVRAVGKRVAAFAPRKTITYQFDIVDMEEPNAFALPGGWVYVSRGILELANSEDELANVIAHEMVHVAARHHAQRHARATGVGILALPALLAGAVIPGVGGLVSAPFALAGAGVLAGYSRDQERQADEVGQKMSAQAGYDPGALATFLETLLRDGKLRDEKPREPSWLDTHPSTAGRASDAARRAQGLAFVPRPGVAGDHAGFLRSIEGVLVGQNPAEGIFEGQRFLHPDMRLTLVFPEGWKTANARDAVGAISEKRDAQLVLTHAGKGDDPRQAAAVFLKEAQSQTRIDVARLDSFELNGLAAVRGQAVAAAKRGNVSLDLTWIALDGAIYQLIGVVNKAYTDAHRDEFTGVVQSFRRLSAAERRQVMKTAVRVRGAQPGETLDAFGRRTGNAWDSQRTAVANGLVDDAVLAEGQLLKIASREPYTGS